MKAVLRACGVLALFLSLAGPAFGYIETFDNNNAGWLAPTVDDQGNVGLDIAGWSWTGGNPDGHVSGALDSDATRLYGIQAPFGTGAFGNLTGQTLTVDYRIDGWVSGPQGARVRFYIGYFDEQSRYWVSNDTFSWDPNADTSWTTHQIQLLESNFTLWPNQNSGDMTFQEVLLRYNDIGLVFADGFTDNRTLGFSGSGTIHVDNFGVSPVPIPGALWLLGSGLLGLAGLRRKLGKV
jgi:hypothetical protein